MEQTIGIGIFEGLSFDDYTKIDAMSASRLALFKKSPLHYQYLTKQPKESSSAQNLGRAIHTETLEPHLFESLFYPLPKLDRRTTEGKQEFIRHMNCAEGKSILTLDDRSLCASASASLLNKKTVSTIIQNSSVEVSLVWKDQETGLFCKGRLDAWWKDKKTILDIKTTRNANRVGFTRSLYGYGYYRQAAWYLAGLRTLGQQADHFIFAAVETSPPFPSAIYRITDEVINYANAENLDLLKKYKYCTENNTWPGYNDGEDIVDISLPSWAINEMEATYGSVA